MEIALPVGATGPRQKTEKVILYKLPTGPVTECTFTRCRLMHTSCLDRMTSSRLFCLTRGVYRRVLQRVFQCEVFLRQLQTFILFSIIKNFYCFWSSYGVSWTEEGVVWPHYGVIPSVRLSVHTSVRPHFRFRTLTRKRFVQSNSNLTGT